MVCPSFQMNIAAGRNVKSQKTTLYKIFHYNYLFQYLQVGTFYLTKMCHPRAIAYLCQIMKGVAKIRRKLCVRDVPLWKIFYVSI